MFIQKLMIRLLFLNVYVLNWVIIKSSPRQRLQNIKRLKRFIQIGFILIRFNCRFLRKRILIAFYPECFRARICSYLIQILWRLLFNQNFWTSGVLISIELCRSLRWVQFEFILLLFTWDSFVGIQSVWNHRTIGENLTIICQSCEIWFKLL